MATWPGGLPQEPDQRGYSEQPQSQLARTEVDFGPALTAKRYTGRTIEFRMTMELTLAQVTTLDDFYATTLNDGADSFTWAHPRTAVGGTFRFVNPPTYRPVNGPNWRATFVVELLPT